uniref:Uncharacterized protein n=1 Tax=Arundo donax TaxID=35708 RepID=A0A0A9D081_ARUDO
MVEILVFFGNKISFNVTTSPRSILSVLFWKLILFNFFQTAIKHRMIEAKTTSSRWGHFGHFLELLT